jgi:hypothetical protein
MTITTIMDGKTTIYGVQNSQKAVFRIAIDLGAFWAKSVASAGSQEGRSV